MLFISSTSVARSSSRRFRSCAKQEMVVSLNIDSLFNANYAFLNDFISFAMQKKLTLPDSMKVKRSYPAFLH